MALSLSFFPVLPVLLLLFHRAVEAATVTYDFNITWVRANPDGLQERPTIGINGKWPLPIMTATLNDTVIVNVNNQLGNQSTTLHFHGLFMNGTADMDGPASVSQCGIPAGSQFTYNFTVSYISKIGIVISTDARTGEASRHILVSQVRLLPASPEL
jgi:iron transport multicopper oxidase